MAIQRNSADVRLIAGAIARFLMRGKTPGGVLVTIALGIIGALVGGFISAQL